MEGNAVMAIESKPGAVPQPGQPNQPPAQQPPRPAAQPASQPEQPRQGNSGQSQDPGEGLREALQASHEARTTVPGRPGVDARLDNRTGAAAPRLEEWPAKPQQVDGPDLAGQAEHTRATLGQLTEPEGNVKGMYSPGPHGLSDEELRESGTAFGPEGLAEAGPGSKA
jgi:hypothetical protein